MQGDSDSAKSPGRISINNPGLVSMLHENNSDLKQDLEGMDTKRRMYVDSPMLDEEDPDKYRFVSGNVEDFDETLEEALASSKTARDQGLLDGGATRNSPGSRYEDRNVDKRYPPHLQEELKPNTQYVVRSKNNSRQSSGHSQARSGHAPGSRGSPKPHAPIHRPIQQMRNERTMEKNELQMEEEYQKTLKNRLLEKAKHDEQIHIPKLDLVDSDDELAMRRAIQGDKRSAVPDDINLRDSLDEDEDEPQDSLDWKDPPRNPFHASTVTHVDHERGIDANVLAGQPFALNSPGMSDNDPRLHQMFGQSERAIHEQAPSLQHPPPAEVPTSNEPARKFTTHKPWAKTDNQNTDYPLHPVQQPVYNAQKRYSHPQTQPEERNQTYSAVQVPKTQLPPQPQYIYDQATHQQQMYAHQNHAVQYPYYQAQPGYHDYPSEQDHGYYEVPTGQPNYQGYYEPNPYPQSQYEGQTESEEVMSPKSESEREGVDYVERNKKTIINPPKRTYGQIFSQRKDSKENVAPRPVKALPGKSPVVAQGSPNRQQHSVGSNSGNQQSPKINSAESVWQRRAQSLTQQKQERLSGGKKAKRTGPTTLKKFPSESRVDDIKNPKPYRVEPIVDQPIQQQSMAEPIRSEIDVTSVSPGQPVRHTVFTDDGQRVSVDINLKLISPPPQKPLPLGPIPQTGRSVVGPIPQQPPNLMYHPGYAGVPPHDQFRPAHVPPTARHMAWQSPHQQVDPNYQPYGDSPGPDGMDHQPGYANAPSDQSPTPIGSPFRVLPPIGSAGSERSQTEVRPEPSSPRKEETSGSYAAQFHNKKTKKVEYKEYTLKDYRKLNQEIRLGGLGPNTDSDEQRQRREKHERQQEYARQINQRNRQDVVRKPPKPKPKESQENEDVLQKRKLALEYAKRVPKPKVREPSGNDSGRSDKTVDSTAPRTEEPPEVINLDKLRQRHEEERQKAALIRQKIETA